MIKKIYLRIILGGVVVISFWICSLLIESRDALKWPQTKGKVLSSLLTIDHLPKFIDFGSDPMRWYGTDVHYEYSVGDRTYISNKVAIRDGTARNPRGALKEMNKYRRQHQVTVFYNPANPQQAVLEPANIGDINIPLMVGVLLVFLWMFAFFDQPVEVNTRWGSDYSSRGNTFQKQGKLDEALNEFNKIIELNPRLVQGYKSRGGLYLQQGKWDDAITDFNQVLLIDPVDASVYFNRANAYLGKEQYDKAWEDMQKAMELGLKVKPEILERIKGHL